MFARSTTVHANPDSIDAGIAHVREEVLPTVREMDGWVGLSMMVDRESGRCILTAAWESQEALRASAEMVRPLRERAMEILGGSVEVDEWEIAVMHRDHHARRGACVRSTWFRVDPNDVDRAVDVYKLVSMPAMESLQGFCSASLLIDRETGRAVSSATYDSREAMEANREDAASVRSEGIREARAEVMDVAEFELVLAHLHVPEMA